MSHPGVMCPHTLCYLLLLLTVWTKADNNFLTGANDIIAVRDQQGDMFASPFTVQFGKKDIWLPRSGHQVTMEVNNLPVGLSMVLDSEGQGYFHTLGQTGGRQYRFWTALLGFGEPPRKQRTNSATPSQLSQLGLHPGPNPIQYRVVTESGSEVTTEACIHLLNYTAQFVVSDIDGTVTKSNVRGFLLPALGLSDWKHTGVVELYDKIASQGYTVLYLTNRPIGQSKLTRKYINSLEERQYMMPRGPILLQAVSLLGSIQTEVISGQPEVNKIASLSRIRGLFPGRDPFYAGFGNKPWDSLAYKAIGINPDRIFKIDEDSLIISEGTGLPANYTQMIRRVQDIFPVVTSSG